MSAFASWLIVIFVCQIALVLSLAVCKWFNAEYHKQKGRRCYYRPPFYIVFLLILHL